MLMRGGGLEWGCGIAGFVVSLLARRFTALAVKNTEARLVFLARLLYLCLREDLRHSL